MHSFFTFDPSEATAKIKLAMAYTPRILNNKINIRPYNGFLYVVRGSYRYFWDGGELTAQAGELIYLPAGCHPYAYSISHDGEESARTLQIEFELINAQTHTPMSFSPHPVLIQTADSTSIRCAMRSAIAAYTKNSPSSRFVTAAELFRILAICNEADRERTDPNAAQTVAPAVAYLEEHFTKPVTSKQLAALCHISESQLRRAFQAAKGMSPMAYRRRLLHIAARNLLRVGEFKVGEIADILGFYDIYAFSHFFTEAEGISPREYSLRAKKDP